jgi:hypothetical protein
MHWCFITHAFLLIHNYISIYLVRKNLFISHEFMEVFAKLRNNMFTVVMDSNLFYPLNKKTIGSVIRLGETLLACKKDGFIQWLDGVNG